MLMYSYCNVYVFLLLCMFYSVYSVSLCCPVYCFMLKCVLYYCHWCLPNCSQQIYHIIPIKVEEGDKHINIQAL